MASFSDIYFNPTRHVHSYLCSCPIEHAPTLMCCKVNICLTSFPLPITSRAFLIVQVSNQTRAHSDVQKKICLYPILTSFPLPIMSRAFLNVQVSNQTRAHIDVLQQRWLQPQIVLLDVGMVRQGRSWNDSACVCVLCMCVYVCVQNKL